MNLIGPSQTHALHTWLWLCINTCRVMFDVRNERREDMRRSWAMSFIPPSQTSISFFLRSTASSTSPGTWPATQRGVCVCVWLNMMSVVELKVYFSVSSVNCVMFWIGWVWSQRMWWSGRVSLSIDRTSTVIPYDRMKGKRTHFIFS